MKTQTTRAKYEAPKLEVQRLRELPSALATSCKSSNGSGCSASTSSTGGNAKTH